MDQASHWFSRGVELEEDPATQTLAVTAYKKVLELEPKHVSAHVNLGTLYYNQQRWALAEEHYRMALTGDPNYTLAYFDLANVLDETGRVAEAIQNYETAVRLAPTYADAHYNLALAYERHNEHRRALVHWRVYCKLDKSSPWHNHAARRINALKGYDLELIWVNPNPKRTKRRAKLFLVQG